MYEENKKQLYILNCFIAYCFTFICLIFYGIGTCYASEHDMGYYSNYTGVLLDTGSGGAPIGLNRDTYNVAGNFYQVWVNIGNLSINSNYIYQMEMSTPGSYLSNVNSVLVTQIVNNGVNQSCNILGLTDNNIGYPKVYFQCKNSFQNGTVTITFYNISGESLTSQPQYFKWGYTHFRYYDDATEIDWGPVTSNANANTDRIIANDNANANSIMNNYNQKSTQDTRDIVNGAHQDANSIKNNANANTEKQIESQKVCDDFMPTSQDVNIDNSFLNSSGNVVSNQSNWIITDYYEVQSLKLINRYSGTNYPSICYYDENKSLLSCSQLYTLSEGSITLPNNTKYIRYSIAKNNNLPTFSITSCKNGNQALADTNKSIFGKIKDLFNWFNNNDDADVSGLNNMVGWLPPGPVDSIINLPLSLFNSLTNTLTGTCQSVSLTLPFVNQTLTFYCFDAYMTQYLSNFSTLWTLVGTILSVFILYHYLLALYKWVDDTLTFRENNLPGYYGDNWGGGA